MKRTISLGAPHEVADGVSLPDAAATGGVSRAENSRRLRGSCPPPAGAEVVQPVEVKARTADKRPFIFMSTASGGQPQRIGLVVNIGSVSSSYSLNLSRV